MSLRSIATIITIFTICLIIGPCRPENITNEAAAVCTTPACINTAKEILEGLDNRTEPCDNFYKFACGNAIKKMTIPSDNMFIDTFDIIRTKVTEQLNNIFNEPVAENETRSISLIKKYYKACMNEEYIEEHGMKILRDLLKELGGWPVVEGDSWKDNNFTWTDLLIKFRKLGLGITYFTEMSVDPDPKNSSKYIIELDQPKTGLLRDLLLTPSKLKPYLDLMINVSVELGADRTRAQKEFNESLEFEIKLAKFSLSPEERHDITKLLNYMTIKELQEKFPKIPWLKYINGLLPSEVQLKENETVLVIAPSYFLSFDKLIKDTPKRVQANYAIWRAVQDIISFSPIQIYRHFQTALQALQGQSERPVRWKECSKTAHEKLPFLASSLYVRKYFDQDAKRKTIEMVKYIKDSFVEILKNLEWMDGTTRQKALNKVGKMMDHVGYPNELINDNLLEEYYKGLELDENSYLRSSLNLTVHQTNVKFRKLRSPFIKTDWTEHGDVAEVGASYNLLENSIALPAGILQGTFFNKDRPNYMNFGAIGSVIAHEITHGFDESGKQFDADGNVVNWWEQETETKFKNKTQCMIHQYGNYTVSQVNKPVNGLRTIDENIADNGGVKEAYFAYKAWVKTNGTEPGLPGVPFTPSQLFWISVARNWCAKYKDEYLGIVVTTDAHSPNEFRVIGPLSNSKDFAADFKCAVGSKMNPAKKCTVW